MIPALIYGKGSGADGARCWMQECRARRPVPMDPASDETPPDVSIVLAKFGIGLNDASERTRAALAERIGKERDTAGTEADERAKALRVLSWYCLEWLPAWLDLCPATVEHAAQLRAIESVVDANAEAVGVIVRAAVSAARSAAWSAAGSAARSALAPTVEKLQDSAVALWDELAAWPSTETTKDQP